MGKGSAGNPEVERDAGGALGEAGEETLDSGEDEGFDFVGEPAGLEEVHHGVTGFVAAFALEAQGRNVAGEMAGIGGGDEIWPILVAEGEGVIDDDFTGQSEEGEGTEAEGLNGVGGVEGQASVIDGGEHGLAAAGGEDVGGVRLGEVGFAGVGSEGEADVFDRGGEGRREGRKGGIENGAGEGTAVLLSKEEGTAGGGALVAGGEEDEEGSGTGESFLDGLLGIAGIVAIDFIGVTGEDSGMAGVTKEGGEGLAIGAGEAEDGDAVVDGGGEGFTGTDGGELFGAAIEGKGGGRPAGGKRDGFGFGEGLSDEAVELVDEAGGIGFGFGVEGGGVGDGEGETVENGGAGVGMRGEEEELVAGEAVFGEGALGEGIGDAFGEAEQVGREDEGAAGGALFEVEGFGLEVEGDGGGGVGTGGETDEPGGGRGIDDGGGEAGAERGWRLREEGGGESEEQEGSHSADHCMGGLSPLGWGGSARGHYGRRL